MRCSRCGHENHSNTQICSACGTALLQQFSEQTNPFADQNPYLASIVPPPPQDLGESAAVRMLVPVGRSIHAIIAGYLGLLSLAFCFLGPIAILFGILAIRDIRQDSRKHGMVRAIVGILFGTIGCVLLIGVLVSMLVS